MHRFRTCCLALLCCSPGVAKPLDLLPKPIDVDHKFLVQQAVVDIGPDREFTKTTVKFTVKNISGRVLKRGTFEKKSKDDPWFGFDLGMPRGSKTPKMGTALGPIRNSDIAPDEVFTVEPSLSVSGKFKFLWIQLNYAPYFGAKKSKNITARLPLPH